MKTIKLKVAVGGEDFTWAPGELVTLPDAVAARWADGVRAEYANSGHGDQRGADDARDEVGVPAGGDEQATPDAPAGEASRPTGTGRARISRK